MRRRYPGSRVCYMLCHYLRCILSPQAAYSAILCGYLRRSASCIAVQFQAVFPGYPFFVLISTNTRLLEISQAKFHPEWSRSFKDSGISTIFQGHTNHFSPGSTARRVLGERQWASPAATEVKTSRTQHHGSR